MRAVTFDVYRLDYDPITNRINNKLIIGGYSVWADAERAHLFLNTECGGVYTIRLCTHSDTVSSRLDHRAITDTDTIVEIGNAMP